MKRYLVLERINQGDKVAIYSPTFDGDDKSELEKFISKFEDDPKFKKDLGTIFARIGIIEEQGVLDRFFRYESKKNDKLRRSYVCLASEGVAVAVKSNDSSTCLHCLS